MFCGECGTQNPDTNKFCKNCGQPLNRSRAAAPVIQPAPAQPYYDPPPGMQQQVPAQLVYHDDFAGVQQQTPSAVKPKRTWLGIASLIPAIFSWIFYPYLLGLATIVLGLISIYLWKRQGTRFPASAVFAIIIGLLAIILNIFWLDIFPPPQVLPPID